MMHWIALRPPLDAPDPQATRTLLGWHALRFTPRVTWCEEALLLEVAASERLFGGQAQLLAQITQFTQQDTQSAALLYGQGSTSLVALAHLRWLVACESKAPSPPHLVNIDDLSLHWLTAAQPHAGTLARMGCRTWGQLRALPRAGVARRFGAALLHALDTAYGQQPETHAWMTLPEHFEWGAELPALAETSGELLWTAQRLLGALRVWLAARHLGIVAIELSWTFDFKRFNGAYLPPRSAIQVRTGAPTQDMMHLRRLVAEHLERTQLPAPVNHLTLRSLETRAFDGAPRSLLPEENRTGEPLHQFIERVSVRLGERNVRVPVLQADHRPECQQRWIPAVHAMPALAAVKPLAALSPHARTENLMPAWLLTQPVRLEVQHDIPQYGGPLRRLARLYRIETGWWESADHTHTGQALRDYFIARSERAGLLWIYRERPASLATAQGAQKSRWFLHGFYA
jgi:protein ImuB